MIAKREKMDFHPIANVFPLLTVDELEELAEDIEKNGLKEPICLFEDKILDGRNRSSACTLAGVEPEYETFEGTWEDAFNHVWSLNFHRRHMTQSQKGSCAAEAEKVIEECKRVAKERQGSRSDLDDATSGQDCPEVKPGIKGEERRVRDEVGKMFGVSGRYVDDAIEIKKKSPELHEKVKSGEITIPQAKKQISKAERQETLKTMDWPKDKYRVIYADPPWKYGDQRLGIPSGGGAVAHYDLMDVDQICEMDVQSISTPNSVLFLWATSPMLREAFKVIHAWGFTYKACFVWQKGRGFNGHYNNVSHEFLLIATRGSCVPDEAKLFNSLVKVDSTWHSRKPEEFREMIDTMYVHGPRIELFARRAYNEKWSFWGNEA